MRRWVQTVAVCVWAGFAPVAVQISQAGQLPEDVHPVSRSRLPPIDREELDPALREAYDAAMRAAGSGGAPTGAAALRLHGSGTDLRFSGPLGRRLTETGRDLWTLVPGTTPEPFLITPFNEAQPSFSPDGRWIAYSSDRSGPTEIYVRPFPGRDPFTQVSTGGGIAPMWGARGDELYYRNGQQVLRVSVDYEPEPRFGTPELLFEGTYDLTAGGDLHYSATPDRQQFLMVVEESATTLRMVSNWRGEE